MAGAQRCLKALKTSLFPNLRVGEVESQQQRHDVLTVKCCEFLRCPARHDAGTMSTLTAPD